MKITDDLKTELAAWLDNYWTTYIRGDLETWATFIKEDYYNIGGTKEEIWHSKQEILDYTHAIMGQMLGKAELRNQTIEAEAYGEFVMVNEFTDMYVLIDGDWIFYGPFRMSSLMEKTTNGWIVQHQHGSFADMKASEGEAFGLDAIKAENERLKKSVEERTSELLTKNQELAIEAALEKVRAVAMGMKKPEEMLDVCREISDQLQQFGVDHIRNVQIAIIDENIGQYLCYQYFTPYDKTTVEITEYLKSSVEHGMVSQMLASRDGYFIGRLNGKELEDFRLHRKEEDHFQDPLLDEATELDYCFLSIGEGGLGLTLYQSMAEEILSLFRRFHQVFTLAYQRFRDIQKAEAQAREAQIEAAVERVRAQSMAMYHPDDLDKVNKEILSQLNWLQIQGLSGVTFYLVDQDGWVKAWDFSSPGNIGDQKNYTLQFDFKKYEMLGYPFKIFQQTDLNYLVADYPLEKLERAVIELEEVNLAAANAFKEALAKGILTHQWSACARISDGILGIDLVSPPSEDTKTIVLKIAGAFNQAYQRFLDLQKAQAQAREAQIEAALERVRAQTMAMHSSEDVGKCVVKMFSELTALGVDEGTRFGIGILNHENENNQLWTARKTGEEVNMHIGNIDMAWHPMLKKARQAWLEQVPFQKYVLEGEDLLNYYRMLNNAPDYKIQIPIEKLPEREIQHCFVFEHGFFYAFSPREFQPELIHITKRFSALFEQTYRRYLDLVRAETQAREAEIELALERVRARTMAMQHSDELAEASFLLDQQVRSLGIRTRGCAFHIYGEHDSTEWFSSEHGTMPVYHTPRENVFLEYYEAGQRGESLYIKEFSGDALDSHYDYLCTLPVMGQALKELKASGGSFPERQFDHATFFKYGYLLFITLDEVPDYQDVFKRFAKVFEQTYTRFLDLQKAEAQAREAQIEAALERVRSRSLAMHKTDELQEVVRVIAEELKNTGVILDTWGAVICTYFQDSKDVLHWTAAEDPANPSVAFLLPYFKDELYDEAWESKNRGDSYFAKVFSFEVKNAFFSHAFEHSDYKQLPEDYKQMILQSENHGIAWAWAKNSAIMIPSIQGVLPSEEEKEILIRFAKVFEQAYIRFLDLQKAEAQAREAQVNLAVERVRARALAMFKSEEILEVVYKLREEIMGLDIPHVTAATIHLREPDGKYRAWDLTSISEEENQLEISLDISWRKEDTHPDFFMREVWDRTEDYFVVIQGNDRFKHTVSWLRQNGYSKQADDFLAFLESSGLEKGYHPTVPLQKGRMTIDVLEPPVAEVESILKKMAGAFDLAYKRFEDLQKAESQTREAKIETALEKIRSRTIGMQSSDELPEVANMMFLEVQALGIPAWSCGYCILLENRKSSTCIMSSEGTLQKPFLLPHYGEASFEEWDDFVQGEQTFFTQELGGKAIESHYEFMTSLPQLKATFQDLKDAGLSLPTYQINHLCKFPQGFLLFITYEQVPDAHDIFKRFTKVFDQTYTRFLDLKKAEAQAQEARIEAALERVRSRSMGMQKSQELAKVIAQINSEIANLGIHSDNTALVTDIKLDKKSGSYCSWFSIPGKTYSNKFHIPRMQHRLFEKMEEAYRKKIEFFTISFTKEEKDSYLNFAFAESDLKFLPESRKAFLLNASGWSQSVVLHKNSGLVLQRFSNETFSEEENAVAIRFGHVFEQTYTRFLDLQKAEAQALEATKQASLDRVRGVIASMRSATDLELITPLIFRELTILGVPFIRCGVFIINEKQELVEAYLSSPEGHSLGVLRLPYQASELIFQTVEAWRRGEVHTQHWNKDDFVQWIKQLMDKDQIQDSRTYQGAATPPESLDLHFVPFTQGMLYVGAVSPLDEKDLELVQALAKAFSVAYARYEDFVKLEQAKAEVESAMSELKATQSQLVQQEKLASLGQLTAGIAHEIKNPLNFVNNFSDLSRELIEEVFEELQNLESSDTKEEIIAILQDVQSNLTKVHEHGTRADSIVTSMLQHSRASGSKREPKAFNPLIKEFVNLSYHGMRAGKAPINVDIDLQLDPLIGDVTLISEDFSRVILNLCNNAFDAMREKLKTEEGRQETEAYLPKLTVTTALQKDKVILSISDNGGGIPKEIQDKILQPFFTTKKGTEGTGLGLSITNDIIKAHGGELDIQSQPGSTIFKIHLTL